MKVIEVPEAIQLIDIKGEKVGGPLTFKDFLLNTPLLDKTFGKDLKSVMSASRIKEAVREANGVLSVEEQDYELLKKAVEQPESGYNPFFAVQLVPFLKAVVEAK